MRHVTCISKEHGYHFDPHHAIERLGYSEGSNTYSTSRIEMYNFLVGSGKAYVKDRYGNFVYLEPRTHGTTKYVQTYADGKKTDNLLYLPECGTARTLYPL